MTRPNRKSRRVPRRKKKRRRRGLTPSWMGAEYAAYIFFMKCDDHPELVKVGLSSDPVRRAFDVEKGRASADCRIRKASFQFDRRGTQSCRYLQYCRARGEWFKCSVSAATSAILYAAGSESGASRRREEWIEAQAHPLSRKSSGVKFFDSRCS